MGAVIKTDSLNQKMWNDVKNAVLGAVEALASKEIKPGPSAEEKEISHRLSLSSVESQMTEFRKPSVPPHTIPEFSHSAR